MGFFQRGLLIYLCIAIAIAMTMPSAIFNGNTPADNTVLSWFNLNYNSTSGNITMQNTTAASGLPTGSFQTPTSPASSSSIIGFIDPIYQVFSWVGTVFKVLFSPIILLTSPAVAGDSTIASGLLFIIGIPAVLLMIVGLLVWIRSGFP